MEDSIKYNLESLLLKIDSLSNQIISQSKVIEDNQSSIEFELIRLNNIVSSLNYNELFLSALVGISTGLIASFIYVRASKRLESKRQKKQFIPVAGTFIRWWRDNKSLAEGKEHVTATITHNYRNHLTIEVKTLIRENGDAFPKDQIQVWTGEVTMDSVRNGTIIWEQQNPGNSNNGFKRIIVERNLNGITLIGESDKGFGIEKFTERKINQFY